jgi:transmembrane sensor
LTNVIKFSNPRQADKEALEQACLWLVKLDAGASKEDLREIGAWLERDPRHARVLIEAAQMWDQASVLSELAELFPLQATREAPSALRKTIYAAAAVLVAGIMLTVGGFLSEFGDTGTVAAPPRVLSAVHETRIGEQKRVALPDGSEIMLNTDTRVEVNYTEAARGVTLVRGEGHFTVAKDATRKFRVQAGSGFVEAIGTAFTVQHILDEVVEVTVTEGEVELTRAVAPAPGAQSEAAQSPPPAEREVRLAAGESATVIEAEPEIQRRTVPTQQLQQQLAWQHGMLIFQGSSLEEVINQVSRYTPVRIEVDDSVKDIPIDGLIPAGSLAGDIDSLTLTMRETFNVDVTVIDENHIRLSSE